MQRFTNRTALITGGTSGMGLATARRLLDEGAYVVSTGQDLVVDGGLVGSVPAA